MASTGKLLKLQIHCVNPPVAEWQGRPTEFGLQDKTGALQPGKPETDGAQVFDCEVQIKLDKDGLPDFAGRQVHGRAGERFLYLSLRSAGDENGQWIRRIKVMLTDITTTQLETGDPLTATIDGNKPARARFLERWH